MAKRPVWVNEVLSAYDGDYDPQYAFEDGKLILLNEIKTEGTPHNADNMNNLYDFDNLASMAGNTRKTVISGSTITETVTMSGITVANRVTVVSGTTITETETIYDDTGANVLRTTKVSTTVSGSTITEVVS